MKPLAPLAPMLLAAPAMAHPGHIADAAGHDHWTAGIAIGLAAAVGLWALVKGRRDKDEAAADEAASEADETAQEA